MLAVCVILACLPAIRSSELYQQQFSPKPLRMVYYTRKIQPSFHERMYPVKPPFRRPYMVYVPKPYVFEVPKPMSYVKLTVPKQFQFEKQLPRPYKIEKPFYVHQLPKSLEGKVPTDIKVPIESPVSVTVEKQVLLPVKLGDEKQTESIQASAYVSIPEEVASHLEIAMNKDQIHLSEFENESLLDQLKANGFTEEDLRSHFVSQSKRNPISLVTERPTIWSSESKTALDPIVVSEGPPLWNSFNISEWVPRFETSDIKTVSKDKYKLLESSKDIFEISGENHPSTKISQDITKHFAPEKNKFVPSPLLETVTTPKHIPFENSFLNEHSSKQAFNFPSSKTYQFYNIETGNVIKPEALTSSIGITNVEKEQKGSHQWVISDDYQKGFQKAIPEHSELNLKWITTQEPYSNGNDPTKKWVTSSGKYLVQTEPDEHKGQAIYDSQKEISQQWSTQANLVKDQHEPDKKWTNGHGQYILQNESDNLPMKQNDQDKATISWIKSGDQYIIHKQPEEQWLKSEDKKYISLKQSPQFAIQEEHGSKVTRDQIENQKAYSSQNFLLSHKHVIENQETLNAQKSDLKDEKYFHSSQQLEGSFKPLIPNHSQISYRYQMPSSESHIDENKLPHLPKYIERKPSYQHDEGHSHYENQVKPQLSADQSTLHIGNEPSSEEKTVHHRQHNARLKTSVQPTSNSNYQQYFRNHQYHQQSKELQQNKQDDHQIVVNSVHSYPQYISTTRHGNYLQKSSQNAYQLSTGKHQDGSTSLEDNEDKGKQESSIFGQKRRHRQPSRGETGDSDQVIRSNNSPLANTTEEPTTAVVPSTPSMTRRRHRRKQKRRNHEATISPTEK